MSTLNTSTSTKSALALAGFAALTVGAATIGARATGKPRYSPWYRLQRKPKFQPPPAVFGPVWTALYTLIALSGWRLWKAPPSPERTKALGLWGGQLALNAAWPVLFFGKHDKRAALVDLALLTGAVKSYTKTAWNVDRPAAAMMAPYAAWSSFAFLLNEEAVRLN